MKFLISGILLTLSLSSFAQVRDAIELGTRLSTKGGSIDQDLVAGVVFEDEEGVAGFRVLIPIKSNLTKEETLTNIIENSCERGNGYVGARNAVGDCATVQDIEGVRYVGAEFLGLYKLNDRLGVGGVAGLYVVNDLNGVQAILGPAARLKLIDAERFSTSVEGRFNIGTGRWEMGGSMNLGRKR